MERDIQYFGAKPKYHLTIEAGGLDMYDFDFTVRLQRGPNSYEVRKNEMIVDNEDFYFIADTTRLGIGNVQLVVVAEIPDTDVQGGVRPEIYVDDNFMEIRPL